MKQPRTYVLIGLALLAAGALAWWIFKKKTLPAQIEKAVGDDLEKINTLSAVVADTYKKGEVNQLIATLQPADTYTKADTYNRTEVNQLIAAVPVSDGGGRLTELSLPIDFDGQTEFAVAANEPRKRVYVAGLPLVASEFTLAPPTLSIHTAYPLKTYYGLTLD